jgi:hypothetical protein
MLPRRTAVLLCLAVGVGLEVWISMASGRREAWDSTLYWTVGLPMAAIVAAGVGALTRGTAWTAALFIVPGQMLAMVYRNGPSGSLWPLTIVLSFLLGLPFALVAFLAGKMRGGPRT